MAAKRSLVLKPPYTRTRVRDNLSSQVSHRGYNWRTTCAHTSWTQNGSSEMTTGTYEEMTDTVTPGWRLLQKQGRVIMNPLRKLFVQVIDNGGYGWHLQGVANGCSSPVWKPEDKAEGSVTTVFLPVVAFRGHSILWTPDVLDKARLESVKTEVATAVRNQRGRSDLNLFETLAEMDQTLSLMDRPLVRARTWIHSADRALASGRFGRHMQTACANAWLAYRYGIVPIVKDIQGVLEGLKKETGNRRETTRAKHSYEENKVIEQSGTVGVLSRVAQYSCTQGVTVRGMSLDDIEVSLVDNLGFTFKGLVTLPWELTAHSFVADWFVNAGDFIGAAVPSPGWNQLGSSMTVITGSVFDITCHSWTNVSPSVYTVLRMPSISARVQYIVRERFSLPPSGLVVKDDFRLDRFTRSADALALLSQQISRVFNPKMRRVGVTSLS